MTKFEQIGVNKQYSTANTAEARRQFAYSCACCCAKGLHIRCDNCAIAATHNYVCAIYTEQEGRKNANLQ